MLFTKCYVLPPNEKNNPAVTEAVRSRLKRMHTHISPISPQSPVTSGKKLHVKKS